MCYTFMAHFVMTSTLLARQ